MNTKTSSELGIVIDSEALIFKLENKSLGLPRVWLSDTKPLFETEMRDCNPGPLTHLSLREAKPINSKKFVLQASYQARAKPCLCLTILERDSETDIMVMRRPSRIVNKTSSKAFLSIAYCENIIKFTFFS